MKHYPPYIIDIARELRQKATPAERILWEYLRNHRLGGLKFKRQHHIDRYIADFYCAELHLIIELEGSIHDVEDQQEYDAHRMDYLEARGMKILRFRNDEVLHNIDGVLKTIVLCKNSHPNLPSPEPGEGSGERVLVKKEMQQKK